MQRALSLAALTKLSYVMEASKRMAACSAEDAARMSPAKTTQTDAR